MTPMRTILTLLGALCLLALPASRSILGQEAEVRRDTPAGTWIGFAQTDDWEAFLELQISEPPNPTVRIVRAWPGLPGGGQVAPGAQVELRIDSSGIAFEIDTRSGPLRFEGHGAEAALDGRVRLGESPGRFSLRRRMAFDPVEFVPYEGAFELEAGRTVYLRRHDNVQQTPPYSVQGASYFLFDDTGGGRRLYPVGVDRFAVGELPLADSRPFFSELAFIRDDQGSVAGLRWRANDRSALLGERVAPYRQEAVRIQNGQVRLSGRLLVPAGPGPHPAAVLLHGLGAFTRNMGGPFLIADFLASRGVAVLTYDKRGVGGSTGGDPVGSRASGFAGDALLAVGYLTERAGIDPDRIGLLGVSDGVRTAQVAAGRSDEVAFLILVSGRGLSALEAWPPERVVPELVSLLEGRGFGEEAIREAVELTELDLAYSLEGVGWEELERAIAASTGAAWFGFTQVGWLGEVSRDHRYWNRYKPAPEDDPHLALRQIDAPILAIWGDHDPSFPPDSHRLGMERSLAEAEHPDYTLLTFENAGHGMEEIDPGGPLRGGLLVDGYFKTVWEWLKERLGP